MPRPAPAPAPAALPASRVSERPPVTATPADTRLDNAEDLLAKGKPVEAAALLQALLRDDPQNEEALVRLGVLYATLSPHPEKGIPLLRGAIEKNPENDEALHFLLLTTTKVSGVAEAANTIRDLYNASPASPRLNGEMGHLLASQGRLGEAIPYLERAAAGPQAAPPVLDLLEQAYTATGDTAKAESLRERLAE